MHKRNTQAVKKQKGSLKPYIDHTTQGILNLADRVDAFDKSEPPATPAEQRKRLISAYKLLVDIASMHHRMVTFPAADPKERKMEQESCSDFISSMREITLQALYTLDSIEEQGNV